MCVRRLTTLMLCSVAIGLSGCGDSAISDTSEDNWNTGTGPDTPQDTDSGRDTASTTESRPSEDTGSAPDTAPTAATDSETDDDTGSVIADTDVKEDTGSETDTNPATADSASDEEIPDGGTEAVYEGCVETSEVPDAGTAVACDWVTIKGGTFTMGSPDDVGRFNEHPEHEVTVPTFEMWRTEVTRDQYMACVDDGVCAAPTLDNVTCNHLYTDRGDHPINCINWEHAWLVCRWLGGRLASEAEWEYAARNRGEDITYPWGEDTPTCEFAVVDDTNEDGIYTPSTELGCGEFSTWPVCSKPLGNTVDGLCDMIGNVYTWVEDWSHTSYLVEEDGVSYPAPDDGSAWMVPAGIFHVLRGGGIGSPDAYRAAYRQYHEPEFEYGGLGVRCARSI